MKKVIEVLKDIVTILSNILSIVTDLGEIVEAAKDLGEKFSGSHKEPEEE